MSVPILSIFSFNMKRVLIYILLFILPIFLLIILIPVNKRYRYQYLENDCFNHAVWIYDRIFKNDTPVDVAFFGSSHTITGINEMEIEKNLTDTGLHVANFGYCRLGNNLTYVLLKDLLKQKHPKLIVIEVRGDEDWFSHPVFPYLADESDVFLPKVLVNRDLFSDLYLAFTYKLQILQRIIFKTAPEVPVKKEVYGFASTNDTASDKEISTANKRLLMKPRIMSETERNFQLKFPRSYNKKVYDLCSRNGIDICFLYLPHFAPPYKKPLEYETYLKHGIILYPPDAIMSDPHNWGDSEHMNKAGANKLAIWLAHELDSLPSLH